MDRSINRLIIQFLFFYISYTNGARKEQTKGCTFDFDKKGNATFYGNNGLNKPELFKGLIKNFFTQAKEDIMD